MSVVSEAVILMAGAATRLRTANDKLLKPLAPLLGRPLVSYTIDALLNAGVTKLNFVVGYEREQLVPGVRDLVPLDVQVRFIENPEWQKQNGISLLAAASHVSAPFLLMMSDHVFDNAVVDLVTEAADVDLLNVAIDYKIEEVFDLHDAMKVQTRDGYVVAIGKHLPDYDAIDTGMFVCPREIFDYLERATKNGDCALADGVRLMAEAGRARAIDIGGAWWHDVDTPEMFHDAEKKLKQRLQTTPR